MKAGEYRQYDEYEEVGAMHMQKNIILLTLSIAIFFFVDNIKCCI